MGKSAVGAGRPRASAHKGRGYHSRSSARRRALRRESILGRAVRGIDGERKPLHAAGRARAVEQHARLLPGWESLTPGSRRTDLGGLRTRSTGTDGGGLPQPECLHSALTGSRPVMVWLHGGGFAGGSGNWLLYEGTNLARKEDVVVVSVTHRLNLFGFLHLSNFDAGEQWARSSNVGMLDIVA